MCVARSLVVRQFKIGNWPLSSVAASGSFPYSEKYGVSRMLLYQPLTTKAQVVGDMRIHAQIIATWCGFEITRTKNPQRFLDFFLPFALALSGT